MLCLADCHNAGNGQCNPGVDYIAKATGLNRKTVMAALSNLGEIGAIQTSKSFGRGSQYTLLTGPEIGTGLSDKSSQKTSTKSGTGPKNGTSAEIGTGPVPKTVPPPVPKTVPEPTREPKKNLASEKYGPLADRMWDRIQPLTKQKKFNRNSWANDLRKLIELDGHTEAEVWDSFLWANKDHFWAANILSPAKLREKMPTINAQRSREKPKSEAPAWR